MDKQVKQRLRAAVSMERIPNKVIADRIGYTETHVSKSLNPDQDVLTEKFLTALFNAFPDFAEKHKEAILNGERNLFTADSGETELLRKENELLREMLAKTEKHANFLQALLDRVKELYPDVAAKLLSSLALTDTKLGADYSNILVGSQGDLKRDFAAA